MSILKVDELQSRTSGNRITLPDVNNYPPYRNLIINGDMSIAQRGTSLTSAGDGVYLLDRFRTYKAGGGEINVEQSTDSPDDYQYSLKVTVGTADSSISSTDYYLINHRIEGYNTSQLNFGSSTAKTITLSFWVKSSLTGTFSGSISNSAENRSYPYSYAISSANTWEYKTVTITGDTTGTWATDNTTGIKVWWSLGNGSNYLGTANAWTSTTSQYGVTGETQLIATASATFQVTGVQLEVGDSATPFEHLPYDVNLQRCQRYYQILVDQLTSTSENFGMGLYFNSTLIFSCIRTIVTMRASPSIDQNTGTNYYNIFRDGAADGFNGFTSSGVASNRNFIEAECNTNVSGTAGHAGFYRSNNTDAFIAFDAEL